MLNVHNNREKQTKDATTLPSSSTDQKSGTGASDVGALAAQLDATIPNDVISKTFRDSLRTDLLKLQEHAGKDIQERASKK